MISVLDFPPEIFHLVCAYLPFPDRVRSVGVCRAWKATLCTNTLHWAEIDLDSAGPIANNKAVLTWTAKAGPHLRRLTLKNTQRVTSTAINGLARRKHESLQHFALTNNPRVTRLALEKLFKGHTPALVRLDLSGTNISETGLAYVLHYSPKLTYLKLSQCLMITGASFKPYADIKSRRLALLDINVAYSRYASEYVADLAKSCPALKHVDFTGCANINQSALVDFAHAPTLISLRVTGIDTTSRAALSIDDSLLLMAAECSAMEVFSLAKCPTLTRAGLSHIAESWPSLRELDVSHSPRLTDDALCLLARACPELRILLVSTCPRIGDFAIVQVLKRMRRLAQLSVANNPNVSDVSITAVTQHANCLTTLDISNCKKITGVSVRNLVSKPGASLELLRLDNCPLVHQETVLTLRQEMRKTKIYACFT
ncbi:hypothetical protein HDU86_005905 [Geranomyces michiganensis]|nr:hypothetical protein HDU86_005905 [Geranomyces michiganensis]